MSASISAEPGDWLDFELDMELLKELGSDQGCLAAWVEEQVADAHLDYDIDAIEWRPHLPIDRGGPRLTITARATQYTLRADAGEPNEDDEYERWRDEVTA